MGRIGKVLLADGNGLDGHPIAEMLRCQGYACDGAGDAAQAAEMMAKTQYDALILDVDTPGNANLSFAREVSEKGRGLSVILVTDHPTLENAIHAVHLPVSAYLVKPIDWNQLRPFIERSIRRSRLFRTVTDVRSRVAAWDAAVGNLQELLEEPLEEHTSLLMGPLLMTTFEGIVESVGDLRRVIDLLAVGSHASPKTEVTGLLHKMELTRAALHETVHVLEETKHAFKSKRLAELRRQLEALLSILERG